MSWSARHAQDRIDRMVLELESDWSSIMYYERDVQVLSAAEKSSLRTSKQVTKREKSNLREGHSTKVRLRF